MKEIVDLIKKLLELVPASLKAGKGVLGMAFGVLQTLGKLLPKKTDGEEAPKPAPEAKSETKPEGKAKGKNAKLGLALGAAFLVATCVFKSLQALKNARQ